MNKNYYPVAFLVLIGVAAFIMYSGILVPKIDLQQYREVCHKYRTDTAGVYTDKEKLSMINKVNYIFPAGVHELDDPLEKEIKTCANELTKKLKK